MTSPRVTELFHDLEQGAVALTSTRRLARQAGQRYAEWKAGRGSAAWPTPRILVYEDWLSGIWQSPLDHQPDAPLLLSDDQELLLWERTIRRRVEADGNRYLLQLSGTARAALRSWRRAHDWELDWNRLRRSGGADTRAFLDWAESVRETLRDRGWLTPAQLPGHLVTHGADRIANGLSCVWWMGFDHATPAREKLTTVLRERGVRQKTRAQVGEDDVGAAVVECSDSVDQWTRVARWARARLTSEPAASLGVVCPDLHGRREQIEEILEDVLHPDLHWRNDAPRVYHLSLGRPLAEYTIVQSALDLLQWTARRIPFDVVSRTLRSPYLGGGETGLEARAGLELTLRKRGRESLTLRRLASESGSRGDLPGLSRILAEAAATAIPDQADAGGWAGFFSDWLALFAWPGDRGLDSHEYQAQGAWREQLSRFAALGAVQRQWTRMEALKKLSAMAGARVLQFHDDQAPLQIMGASEAAGLWFDEVWLADMSDAVWPPPAQPDPFIPVAMQKELGMPEAAAQTMLQQTRLRTHSLLAGAGRAWISFAGAEADAPVALSPLFDGLPASAGGVDDDDAYPGRTGQLLATGRPLESVVDHRAPALTGDRFRGGVSLIADQARCPFRAFAHFRLDARALREVEPGLSPAERGTVVHRAAAALWDSLGDQRALSSMSDDELQVIVGGSVDRAMDRLYSDSPFEARFLDIERRRLIDLLLEWLPVERQRSPFRVAATELDTRVEIGGGSFEVRVDRIDELPDGRRVIIDYKTGRLAGINEWIDPRMEEPQLPMYALSVDESVAALVLAGIRRGECELRGIGEGVDGIPSLKPVSDLQFDGMARIESWWSSVLGEIATGHRLGDARVDPKHAKTCQLCDAMNLCRIFERRPSFDDQRG